MEIRFLTSPCSFCECVSEPQIAGERGIGIPMRNIRQTCKHDFPLPPQQASPAHKNYTHKH